MNVEHVSAAGTAKLIRAALKHSFPGVRFSVRSRTYAGGASINVEWTDGPTARMVEAVAGQFAGGRFDGSIDMKIGVHHWLMPDGTATVASTNGTEGSKGCIPARQEPVPHPNARLVHFCADFVFCTRRHSTGLVARVLERRRVLGWPTELLEVRTSGCGGAYVAARSHADGDAELWEREARVAVARFMVVQAGNEKSAMAAPKTRGGVQGRGEPPGPPNC